MLRNVLQAYYFPQDIGFICIYAQKGKISQRPPRIFFLYNALDLYPKLDARLKQLQ
jgi:hypothetical protein